MLRRMAGDRRMDRWRAPSAPAAAEELDREGAGGTLSLMRTHTSSPPGRSAGALRERRVPLPWRGKHGLRILSIDGGGIRGIFPAAFLAGLENRYLGGSSVARYFDLIVGTSTGGIIALALSAGLTATAARDLYVRRGDEIFPPPARGILGAVEQCVRKGLRLVVHRYDRFALEHLLRDVFQDRQLRDARSRLCIPSFDGRHGEVYIFKTPHHPDYRKDAGEWMRTVAAATSAAPTYYRPLVSGGYTFVDGGVWANNPIMIGLVDALACFAIDRGHVRILSLGCGSEHYIVTRSNIWPGGLLAWRKVVLAAMALQSQNAIGQASLLIGADRIRRVEPPIECRGIALDDWVGAIERLPEAAEHALDSQGEAVASSFLCHPVEPFLPFSTA